MIDLLKNFSILYAIPITQEIIIIYEQIGAIEIKKQKFKKYKLRKDLIIEILILQICSIILILINYLLLITIITYTYKQTQSIQTK